jgi:beta-carotene hydroxylase
LSAEAPVGAPVPALESPRDAALAGPRPRADWRTGFLIAAMTAGLALAVALHHAGRAPFWPALAAATLLMNLSFTAWHEPAHGNFSRSRRVNDAAGVLASFVSVYPGYFARRREHLVHHRFEGEEGKDPVYARIQASVLTFPWQLLRAARVPLDVPASFVPLTKAQRLSDRASNALALLVAVGSIPLGWGPSVLGLWILPRVIVFWLHAYYVCLLPHAVPGGGYRVYRIRGGGGGLLLRLLTVDQTFHGIHHRWPSVPWHAYARTARRRRDRFASDGIEVV